MIDRNHPQLDADHRSSPQSGNTYKPESTIPASCLSIKLFCGNYLDIYRPDEFHLEPPRDPLRDNVFDERLWCASMADARTKTGAYLNWYNKGRAHSRLGDQTPDEAYWALLLELKKAA